jgi:hypothetical protein
MLPINDFPFCPLVIEGSGIAGGANQFPEFRVPLAEAPRLSWCTITSVIMGRKGISQRFGAEGGAGSMLRLRRVVASLWLMGLFCVWFATAQDAAHVNSAKTGLDLVTIGHRTTKSGHLTAFRIYEAPDGTKGQIAYTDFDSLQAAQRQIEEWVKATRTVTSREKNQTNNKGQLVSDRILAVGDLPKSDKKEFVVIRRDELKCYLIESESSQVAMEVEGTLVHK